MKKKSAPISIFLRIRSISTFKLRRFWLIAPPNTTGESANCSVFISWMIFINPIELKLNTAFTVCLATAGTGSPVTTRKLLIPLICAPKSWERMAMAFLSRQHKCGMTHIPVSLDTFSAIRIESTRVLPEGESGKVSTSTSLFLNACAASISFLSSLPSGGASSTAMSFFPVLSFFL